MTTNTPHIYRLYARHPRGFTLFFASLVASLALAIGLSLYDLTTRELDLSGVTAQSQYAIYAADTGAECALYWDAKYNCVTVNGNTMCQSAFATSSSSVTPTTIPCAGATVTIGPIPSNTCPTMNQIGTTNSSGCTTSSLATTTFLISQLNPSTPAPGYNATTLAPCVKVEIGKSTDANGVEHTTIFSHGYNTCSGSSQLERELQLNY